MTSVNPPTMYPEVGTTRQIQQLALLGALLPAQGKLHELLELALSLDENKLLPRVKPMSEFLHPHAFKEWMSTLGDPADDKENQVVLWQNNSENVEAAIRELKEVEERLGVRLAFEKIS
jgi:Family of unknown function (DUF5950)